MNTSFAESINEISIVPPLVRGTLLAHIILPVRHWTALSPTPWHKQNVWFHRRAQKMCREVFHISQYYYYSNIRQTEQLGAGTWLRYART